MATWGTPSLPVCTSLNFSQCVGRYPWHNLSGTFSPPHLSLYWMSLVENSESRLNKLMPSQSVGEISTRLRGGWCTLYSLCVLYLSSKRQSCEMQIHRLYRQPQIRWREGASRHKTTMQCTSAYLGKSVVSSSLFPLMSYTTSMAFFSDFSLLLKVLYLSMVQWIFLVHWITKGYERKQWN